MVQVTELGYMGIGVKDLDTWKHFAATITADTLVVWGREDKLVPLRHGEILAERIPQAKLVVIAESGHTPMREKRETFQRIVPDFLIGQEEDFA